MSVQNTRPKGGLRVTLWRGALLLPLLPLPGLVPLGKEYVQPQGMLLLLVFTLGLGMRSSRLGFMLLLLTLVVLMGLLLPLLVCALVRPLPLQAPLLRALRRLLVRLRLCGLGLL